MPRLWIFGVRGVRRLSFFSVLSSECPPMSSPCPACAIPNCGVEDRHLFPCCGAVPSHCLHLECLGRLFETNDDPCCPLCRDGYLSLIKNFCIKNPYVSREDDDDNDDSDYVEETEEEENATVTALREEVSLLRDLVHSHARLYERDYAAAATAESAEEEEEDFTRTLPSPRRLRPRP